jgi:hypothetical protein
MGQAPIDYLVDGAIATGCHDHLKSLLQCLDRQIYGFPLPGGLNQVSLPMQAQASFQFREQSSRCTSIGLWVKDYPSPTFHTFTVRSIPEITPSSPPY